MVFLRNRCRGSYAPKGQVATIVKPTGIIEVMDLSQSPDATHNISRVEIDDGLPNGYPREPPHLVRKVPPCQGFHVQHETCSSWELKRVTLNRANDVPPFVINETIYVVRGKSRRDPALQAAVTKQKEEEEGKQGRLLAFPNKN
jgi:hypothetical protein